MGTGITDSSLMRWKYSSQDTWDKEARGFTGQIVRTLNPTNYQLTINPGAIVTNHRQLRDAKNEFRIFLQDKPVF